MSNLKQEGYRSAFKATAIFGGVQFFTILISILKSKVIAIWLGTSGLGILSLFSTSTNLIFSISNLGLQSSAVRDIAEAQGQNDRTIVSKIIKAINRWVYATGLVGAIITISLSPWLSQWLFESNKYTISFILLSSVVFLSSIYNGNYATLQGTRNLKLMAQANIFGAIAGFVCSVPMFYFFGKDGILGALILTAVSTTIISLLFARKVNLIPVKQSYKDSFSIGLKTAKLGIAMAISSILVLIIEFTVKSFIARQGGVGNVGLYQAGWALNASYLGMVFSAMGKDYFPRLSQCSRNNQEMNAHVNHQSEIAILILSPLIMGMIVFMPILIQLLYSAAFLDILTMTTWLMIGSLIKAGSWGISFVFLAKSDVKLFLINEIGINCVALPAYLLGYHLYGLAGIGYAFTLIYLVYFGWVGLVAYNKYEIKYSKTFWKQFVILLFIIVLFPISKVFLGSQFFIGIVLFILVGYYSLHELNDRLNLVELLRNFRKK